MSIVTSPSSEGPIDHEVLARAITALYDKKADSIFVIMDKKRTTIVKDPGLSRPWSSTNPKLAAKVAKEVAATNPKRGAVVVTLSDAIKLLIAEQVKKN